MFFVGSEEEKEPKVVIKHFGGEESVVQRAKEVIKAEAEEGGMRAFVESRAEGAKPTKTEESDRLSWGYVNLDRVLAAGLESGQLELCDPARITHETG